MSSISDWLIVAISAGPSEEEWQMAGSNPTTRARCGCSHRETPVAKITDTASGQIMCVSRWPSAVYIHAASAESILA